MDEMIDNGIVESASSLLRDDDPEVRQQAALLIGSFVTSVRAREGIQPAFEGLQQQLLDESLAVREACSWAFFKLSLNRHGTDMIVESESALAMI
jgi:HEAT repeat protein